MRRDPIDALAEAMREERLGRIDPPWPQLGGGNRAYWMARATEAAAILRRVGFAITPKEP